MGILIGVFTVAIFTDLKYYRIPNPLILFGTITGLIYTTYMYSVNAALVSLVCMAVVFACFFPFYMMGGIGAGDIKLFMMTACYIRKDGLLNFILVTMAIGAVISIIKMIAYKESRNRLIYLAKYIRKAVFTRTLDEYVVDKTDKRAIIRMAVPAFISLILMCTGVYA